MLKPDDAPRTLWSTRVCSRYSLDVKPYPFSPDHQPPAPGPRCGLRYRSSAPRGSGGRRIQRSPVIERQHWCVLSQFIPETRFNFLRTEFVISDLALASHSIPSFTLSASNLLSSVLESHPPSAIITHASMLTQILELIYDAGEANRNHTIVVVGEPSPQAMASVASKVKVLKWADVEREGIRVEKIISPLPSEFRQSRSICTLRRCHQSPVTYSLFHSSPPSLAISRVHNSPTKTSPLESLLSARCSRFLMHLRHWTRLSQRIPWLRHMGEPSHTRPSSRERALRP